VEVSIKNSPTGHRMLTEPYPNDNEARTMGLPEDLVDQLADWITTRRLAPNDLLFATREGTPISRTFRTRIWLPAIKASGVDFDVRVHDLRHAHASWLLADGSDLKSVIPDGSCADHHHPEVPTFAPRRRRQEPRRPQQDPRPTSRRRQCRASRHQSTLAR
jgi:integrase